ncbi:MAG: hypothetical protein GX879_06045 [Bacteroidales bacterium]|nr:hypothetical protein [Bacteroidales bacterium]
MEKIAEKIQRRRLQILIHSKIYYDFNTNLISDQQFDQWGKELMELQKQYPHIAKEIHYHKEFKDWDNSTGMYLPLQDTLITSRAYQLLDMAKQKGVINEYSKIQSSSRKKNSEKSTGQKNSGFRINSLF